MSIARFRTRLPLYTRILGAPRRPPEHHADGNAGAYPTVTVPAPGAQPDDDRDPTRGLGPLIPTLVLLIVVALVAVAEARPRFRCTPMPAAAASW